MRDTAKVSRAAATAPRDKTTPAPDTEKEPRVVGFGATPNLPTHTTPPPSTYGETVCIEKDLGEAEIGGRKGRVVDRELYSFAKITQRLEQNPALANFIGLSRVTTCDEARHFVSGQFVFETEHPEPPLENSKKQLFDARAP